MTTEIEEKERAVTVVERAALALGADEHEKELVALSKKYKDIVEIKNPAGRQQCHAAAMELGTARIATTKTGESAREDANAFQKAVIAEVKRRIKIISDEEARLLALRDAWDAEREAEKIAKALAESQRITAIRQKIDAMRNAPANWLNRPSAEIGAAADELSEMVMPLEVYAEYTGEAQAERDTAVKQLRTMQEAMRQHEEAQAELARKQAELVEQERLAGIARAEQEAAEAEQRAAQDRAAEAMRVQQEEHQARMQAQQEELDRKQAAIDAVAAEQERVAREAREAQEAEERRQREATEAAERAEAERVQAAKDAAEAERVRQVEAAAEEERQARATREAADTAMRNAASALYAALISQVSWAGEVSDEFLDGEPGLRDQFVADRKAAADALKLARGEA